jgi:hypothetical protein
VSLVVVRRGHLDTLLPARRQKTVPRSDRSPGFRSVPAAATVESDVADLVERKGGAMNSSGLTTAGTRGSRELASRESDGVHVLLLWHPTDGTVTVSVDDSAAGAPFRAGCRPSPRPRCLLSPVRVRRLTGHWDTAGRRYGGRGSILLIGDSFHTCPRRPVLAVALRGSVHC